MNKGATSTGSKKFRSKKYSLEIDLKHINWDKAEKIFSAEKSILLSDKHKSLEKIVGSKEILKLLAAGGVIALSVAFPTLPMIITPFLSNGSWRQRQSWRQT